MVFSWDERQKHRHSFEFACFIHNIRPFAAYFIFYFKCVSSCVLSVYRCWSWLGFGNIKNEQKQHSKITNFFSLFFCKENNNDKNCWLNEKKATKKKSHQLCVIVYRRCWWYSRATHMQTMKQMLCEPCRSSAGWRKKKQFLYVVSASCLFSLFFCLYVYIHFHMLNR